MTTGNELTVREYHDLEVQRDPARVIETAINAAKVLKDVVSKKPNPVIINGEQYLEFEDLQLLGQFYGYTVRSLDAEPVEVNGVQGAKARAELLDFRTGEVAGGAVAYCMADEERWRNRPWFQLASMAQCVPLDSEILTERGFRLFSELHVGEPVLAYDCATDACRWVPLEAVNVFPAEKPMVRLRSRSFRMRCTIDHSWAVRRLRGTARRPEQVMLKPYDLFKHHHAIIVAAKAENGHSDITSREAAIMGWLLTDGSVRPTESNRWRGHIDQANPRYIPEIRELVGSVALKETVTQPNRDHLAPNGQPWGKLPCSRWSLSTDTVSSLFDRFGIKSMFDLPGAVTRLSAEARRAMLMAMLHADGHNIRGAEGLWRFAKNDPTAVHVFQILCALEGVATGIPERRPDVAACLVTRRHRVIGATSIAILQADPEETWCPTTPLGTWVMRQNGQVTITGNTRAGAKAFRNRLAWIVVLAGYKATPAEEMTGDEKAREREAEHFCPIHKTAFKKFAKEGRSWYSHKLTDGGYCNEDKLAPIEHQAKPAASPKADSKPAGNADPAIDPNRTEFAHVGELFTWGRSTFGLTKEDMLAACKAGNELQIKNYSLSADLIRAYVKGKMEEIPA